MSISNAAAAGEAAPAERAPRGHGQPRALGQSGPLDVKKLATAQARCALWGGTLSSIHGDDGRPLYVVSRWSLTKSFTDLDDVDKFLRAVGAPA